MMPYLLAKVFYFDKICELLLLLVLSIYVAVHICWTPW